jgi:hypothetical protein
MNSQLREPDCVRLTQGTGKGAIGWVSASPGSNPYVPVAEGYVRVDFEDGIRCFIEVEKLEKVA